MDERARAAFRRERRGARAEERRVERVLRDGRLARADAPRLGERGAQLNLFSLPHAQKE